MLRLEEDDSLFDSNSYIIVHNRKRFRVDPIPISQFSRKFAEIFQRYPRKCVITDNFSQPAFETYLYCCQMNTVAASAPVLVDLLLISEVWDSPTLIAKIEEIIKTFPDVNEIIRLYQQLLDTDFNTARLEKIITLNLPHFLEAPRFATLQFSIIERMIINYPGKLTATQIMKLCYDASAFCGLDSLAFIKRYSFDDMERDEMLRLCKYFENCPFIQLHDFLVAMSRLVHDLLIPIEDNEKFDETWKAADTGDGDAAYEFYRLQIKEEKKKELKAKLELERQKSNTRGGSRNSRASRTSTRYTQPTTLTLSTADIPDEEFDHDPQNPTQLAFIRAAAERGNAEAQFIYGKYIFNHRTSELKEDEALEFLIQAAAKSVPGAKEFLAPFFNLSKVDPSIHTEIFQVLGLQNLLLTLSADNFESNKMAILELSFGANPDRINALAQNIMKAVQIRQRNVQLYAKLVKHLAGHLDYDNLTQAVFGAIMGSLYVVDPMHAQFLNVQFLRVLYETGVVREESFVGPLIDFLRGANQFLKSALLLYYFFADLIMEVSDEIFTFLKLKLFNYHSGMGNLDRFLLQFKDEFGTLMRDNASGFKNERKQPFIRDPLTQALLNDDLRALRRLKFDLNEPIANYCVDLTVGDGTYGTEQLLPIQFAATQGSEACFLYLFRRMPRFSIRRDSVTATCVAAGQNKFILGFITGLDQEMREEMLRMAAKWNNMYLMVLLMQSNIDVNAADEPARSTALHFAARNGNPAIVNLLCHTDGINVNAVDHHGITPLHYAVFGSKLDVTRILTATDGIDVNAQDEHRSTPLHYAVWNNDVELVQFLLALPAIDPNCRAKLDRTPLHEASKCGFLEIIRMLVQHVGVDMNSKDKNGRTPLKLAMKRGQLEVCQFLKTLAKVQKVSESDRSSGAGSSVGEFDPDFLEQN